MLINTALLLLMLTLTIGCAKISEGIDTLQNDDNNGSNDPEIGDINFSSPEITVDFNAFKTTLHPVLRSRCTPCHADGYAPDFAHANAETAYSVVISKSMVNLNASQFSVLVKKPTTLHKCEQPDCGIYSDEIKVGVDNWANIINGTETTTTDLGSETAPNNENTDATGDLTGVTPGTDNSSSNAEHISAFKTNLYPTLVEQCGENCHANNITPKFAHPDISTAFTAVAPKVNLSNVSNSQLVKKPLGLHNCTQPTCQTWSDNIKTGIEAWANAVVGSISGAGINGASIVSKTMLLADGKKDEGAGRIEDAIIAKYEFKTGEGPTAFDTSGVFPPLDLSLSDNVNWIPGKGVELTDPNDKQITKLVGGENSSRKLYKRIAGPNGTKQFSIEAWLINASTALDGPARIVSYSLNSQNRNFTMGQDTSYYNFRNRSDVTGTNGSSPALESDNDADDLKTQLQHVVFTFDETNGRNIYVNGIKTNYEGVDSDPAVPAKIISWDDTHTFILGNEVPNNTKRQWLGKLLFVAIHDRTLTEEEIIRNTLEGIGDRFILEFDITPLLDASGSTSSKIKMVVSELDAYSYVFGTPILITNMPAPNIPVKNMRIAINGNIPTAAQVFRNIDLSAISDITELSSLGAVIPKDTGAETDKFSLVFEKLGNNNNIIVEQNPVATPDMSINPPSFQYGIRTFGQIDNTMSVLTGVDKAIVKDTYQIIEQQLPGIPNLSAFVSSNQIGIAKLSLEYCDAMVENTELRTGFFGNTFEFTSPVATAFSDQTKRDIIINNVVNNFIGTNLSNQPSLAEIQPELNQLIDELSVNCAADADCDAIRTNTIVKAVCASVLASAAISIE